jgi:osmoprotectant transport system permease protein
VSPPSPSSVLANGPDSFIWWSWIGDHGDEIWTRTREHVQLTVIAVAVGFAISVVLSLIAVRYRWTYAPITWIGSVLYTIPSLALFGFLIPFTGLGLLTAEIALVSYTILILVRNIVAGIDGVPRAVREAADGMGYTSRRRLWTVELPLALPTIIAGLRIASVTIIGLVTIAALVGIGGYGTFIDDGLSRNFSTPIVLGAVLSVALALLVDIAFAALLWFLTPWRRRAAARTT